MKKIGKRNWWMFSILLIVIVAAGIYSQAGVSSASVTGAVNKGQPAPAFNLKDLQGNQVSLADFKGQKVYVKFWASWCPICLAGLDELNQLSGEKHDYKVITIVSPGYNGEQSEADFVNWFSKRGYNNIQVLLDDGGNVARQFGVRGYPSSYYIGSDGILAKSIPGHNPNEMIEQTMKSIH